MAPVQLSGGGIVQKPMKRAALGSHHCCGQIRIFLPELIHHPGHGDGFVIAEDKKKHTAGRVDSAQRQ